MYVAVDIGGTKILVTATDSKLKLIRSLKVPTPPDSTSGMAHILELISRVSEGATIDAIGISTCGPQDLAKGILTAPPNIPGWHNAPIVGPIKHKFRVPITFENDANAAGLAEATLGAGRDSKYLLYVTISTGFGTGMVIDREIYHGAADIEGGHIVIDSSPAAPVCGCGRRGHIEGICSGLAIQKKYGKIAADIHDAKTWDEISRNFALALHNLIMPLRPDTVILGGGVSTHYSRFKAPLMKHLSAMQTLYPLPKIKAAHFRASAPTYGALLMARRAHQKT